MVGHAIGEGKGGTGAGGWCWGEICERGKPGKHLFLTTRLFFFLDFSLQQPHKGARQIHGLKLSRQQRCGQGCAAGGVSGDAGPVPASISPTT